MKHTRNFLVLLVLLMSADVNAQIWMPGTGSDITTTTTGDCFIGNNLSVQGGIIDMNGPGGADLNDRYIKANSTNHSLQLESGAGGAFIGLYGIGKGPLLSNNGSIYNVTTGVAANAGGVDFIFAPTGGGAPVQNMLIRNDGLVQIDHTLAVQGDIIDMNESGGADNSDRYIRANSMNHSLQLESGTGGAFIGLNGLGKGPLPANNGSIYNVTTGVAANGGGVDFVFSPAGGGPSIQNMLVRNDGLVQVNHTLAVQGDVIDMNEPGGADNSDRYIRANSTQHSLQLESGPGGAFIGLNGVGKGPNPSNNGSIYNVTSGSPDGGVDFIYQPVGGTPTSNMLVRNDGAVIIGNNVPIPAAGGYNLYVQHGILTEKLKVAIAGSINWADFVFNKEYNLMPLNEVESFVQKNKHLPEVPSAKEVAKDGIDVASMDAKLLQKIEELTLYVIQQQKEIEELKKK